MKARCSITFWTSAEVSVSTPSAWRRRHFVNLSTLNPQPANCSLLDPDMLKPKYSFYRYCEDRSQEEGLRLLLLQAS